MDVTVIFNQMIVLFLIMLLGYYCYKKDIITEQSSKKLSSLVVNITNPALILSSVLGDAKIGTVSDLILVAVIATLMHIGLIGIAFLIPKLLRTPKSEQGIYNAMTVFSNLGFMGFPVISAIFGKEVLLYGAIFLFPYNILAYTYGIYMLTKDNKKSNEKSKFQWKSVFNAGVISSIIAVIIFTFQIKLPSFLVSSINMISNITTPTSMMVIGVSIGQLSLIKLFTNVRLYLFSIIKLVIIPIISYFILKPIIADQVIFGITLIMLCMPVGSMTAMLAKDYGGNDKLAAEGILLTTIMSVITIPLVVLILF